MYVLTSSPFGNFVAYSEDWNQKALPIRGPFYPLFKQTLISQEPTSNTIKIYLWITAVVFTVIYYGIVNGRLRVHFYKYPEETVAFLSIILFQLSNNSPWAWAEFLRFIAPVVPFLLSLSNIETFKQRWLFVAAPILVLAAATQIAGLKTLLHCPG